MVGGGIGARCGRCGTVSPVVRDDKANATTRVWNIARVARNDVQMKMRYRLPGRRPDVHADVESVGRTALHDRSPHYLRTFREAEPFGRCRIEPARDMPTSDEQCVPLGDWKRIPQPENELGLEEDAARVDATKGHPESGICLELNRRRIARSTGSPTDPVRSIPGNAREAFDASHVLKNGRPDTCGENIGRGQRAAVALRTERASLVRRSRLLEPTRSIQARGAGSPRSAPTLPPHGRGLALHLGTSTGHCGTIPR